MERRWYSWTRLPVAFGALALGLCSALLIANLTVEFLNPGNPIKLFPGLAGVTAPEEPPALSRQSMLSGAYQQYFARDIGSHLPLYPAAVRLRNQIGYSLFDMAGPPNLVVGRDGELIERVYIDEYCSRNLAQFLPRAEAWAKKLREMQDDTERRGKTFLYVITPSKVGQYPGYVPQGIHCPASEADRTGFIPAWVGILRRAGVHFVDTTAILSAAHGAYPFDLWPRGGTHWDAVGAALGSQAVEAALASMRHDEVFAPFTFTWHMVSRPRGSDDDLAVLMNLDERIDNYAVPALSITWGPAACRKLNVTVVGGSFMIAIAQLLGEGPCRPHFVEYEYWKSYHLTWPNGVMAVPPMDDAERARDVMGADVLIYEENEQNVARSNHGPALYDFLAKQPDWLRERAQAAAP
jgi:alginate O-acetyltransferase complex protein AlgJ